MNRSVIEEGCELYKAIVAEDVTVGTGSKLGIGDEVENETDPHIYNHGLVTVGEKSIIPPGVIIGKNTCIFGATEVEDYPDGNLASGKTLIKAGEEI